MKKVQAVRKRLNSKEESKNLFYFLFYQYILKLSNTYYTLAYLFSLKSFKYCNGTACTLFNNKNYILTILNIQLKILIKHLQQIHT